MSDFSMREGTDHTIRCIVTGFMNALSVNVSTPSTIDVTFWKVGSSAVTPALVKATDKVTVTANPLATIDTTLCCISIPILEADAQYFPVGSYRYEVSVIKAGKRQVVYPLAGSTATFDVTSSDTWKDAGEIVWPEV
jgi:hypothetical protein